MEQMKYLVDKHHRSTISSVKAFEGLGWLAQYINTLWQLINHKITRYYMDLPRMLNYYM